MTWTTITSFSAFVRVFMLMFSFMLCSFKRKSNLGFSCSPVHHFGKLLSFICSFKIWKLVHQIILVKWYPSYVDLRHEDFITRSCRGWIGCQIFDQLHWYPGSWSSQSGKKYFRQKHSQNLKAYPDLYWNLFKGSLLVNCERRIVRRVVVGQHHKLGGFFTIWQ